MSDNGLVHELRQIIKRTQSKWIEFSRRQDSSWEELRRTVDCLYWQRPCLNKILENPIWNEIEFKSTLDKLFAVNLEHNKKLQKWNYLHDETLSRRLSNKQQLFSSSSKKSKIDCVVNVFLMQ